MACDHLLRYAVGLANGMAEADSSVTLLTRDHDHDFGGETGAMERYLDGALDARVDRVTIRGRVRDLSGWRQVAACRARLRKSGSYVAHLQDSVVTDPRLAWAVGARRGRYALTVHDPGYHPGDRGPSRAQRWLRKRLIQNSALIFVHGEAMREDLLRLESPRARIAVVPHGSRPSIFAPLPERPVVLFFGRLSHYKGLDVLLDAMPELWRRLPEARLTIAGRGELPRHPVLDDGRVEVQNRHIADGEVADLFANATCVALPYRQASQSGVGALALEHGRAVVATAVGALGELVTDRVGRLVAPEQPAAFAEALMEVLATPGLAERLGRNGAGESVSWDEVAALTLEHYARYGLVGQARTSGPEPPT